jgi:uncharacterized protein involved in tolerance to divalent cations
MPLSFRDTSPHRESEVALIMITRNDLSDALYEIILEYHPAKIPAIVTIPIDKVHTSYEKYMIRYLTH